MQPLSQQKRFARVEQISTLIDSAFAIPGTKYRFGLNGIVGLVPGGGDLLLGIASLWLVNESRLIGVSKKDLTRMIGNVALEVAVGSVPVLGDLFDVALKANMRNLKILRKHMVEHSKVAD